MGLAPDAAMMPSTMAPTTPPRPQPVAEPPAVVDGDWAVAVVDDEDVDEDEDDRTEAPDDAGDDHNDKDDDNDDDDDDDDAVPGEFVCYGDRLCFLCEGQLMALTRKFNLTYEQMALLALSTALTGGLMGIASFFIWRRGLFRKRYAALLSDLIYEDGNGDPCDPMRDDFLARGTDIRSLAADRASSVYAGSRATESDPHHHHHHKHGLQQQQRKAARAVAFRIFAYDPATQGIDFGSLGQPVRFDTPLVIAHAASRRAIRFQSHRGAVTISRPPRDPQFHRRLRATLEDVERSLGDDNGRRVGDREGPRRRRASHHRPRPHSLSTSHFSARSSASRVHRRRSTGDNDPRCLRTPIEGIRAPPSSLASMGQPPLAAQLVTVDDADRPDKAEAPGAAMIHGDDEGSCSPEAPKGKPLYRSISETCAGFVQSLQRTLRQQQAQAAELRRRQRHLKRHLPNMSFGSTGGQYFVARIQPVLPPKTTRRGDGDHQEPLPEVFRDWDDQCLRWGAPMRLVAEFNGRPCGFRAREYYRDSQRYMSTEVSATTMIPIPETGDLETIARESTRLLGHMEHRRVRLRVGTYNVWMMPRKLSAFTSISPKKNTRAKLIAEVLPPCDLWVFTECFDHRGRGVLLDRLKAAGYHFDSPTVGHKQRGPDGRYLDKLLNGGVVLASKYPILSVRIRLFKGLSAGSDKFADKGVLYCKLLKDGLIVHVFSTHLQAWNDDLSRKMRRAQLEMITELKQSLHIDERTDVVLYVGDLNVNFWLNKQNGEYDEMLEILQAEDPALVRKATPPSTTATSASTASSSSSSSSSSSTSDQIRELKRGSAYSFDPRVNPLAGNGLSSDGSLELLDYVLYSRGHRLPSSATSWVQPIVSPTPWVWRKAPQYHLSDHFPVISEFAFDMWRE